MLSFDEGTRRRGQSLTALLPSLLVVGIELWSGAISGVLLSWDIGYDLLEFLNH